MGLGDVLEGSREWGFALDFVLLESADNSGKITRIDSVQLQALGQKSHYGFLFLFSVSLSLSFCLSTSLHSYQCLEESQLLWEDTQATFIEALVTKN